MIQSKAVNPTDQPAKPLRKRDVVRKAASLVLAPLGAVLLAAACRIWLEPLAGQLPTYFTFYLAVVVSAWYGGGVSGILAWLAGLVVAHFVFAAPVQTLPGGTPRTTIIYFTTSSAVTILLFELQRRAQSKLLTYGSQLEDALDASKAANGDVVHLNEKLREAMRETHHRVKNNLQVISALIDIRVTEGAAIQASELQELNMHVRALAAIHDVLTGAVVEDGSSDTMSAKQGIERVVALLATVLPDRQIEAELDDIRISQRYAASLAILVNELVSNAAKHGGNTVQVKLLKRGEFAVFSVIDDGPGFKPGFQPEDHANTGLELVERLARWDLRGSTEYGGSDSGGARITITFPLQEDSTSAD